MGYTDAKGRPELVVHPDIIGSRAVYRPAETVEREPAPESPCQPSRREQIEKMTAQRRAQRKAGDSTQGGVTPPAHPVHLQLARA